MCGIFGYIGKRTNAPELVIQGLKTLEYRGYDSWGVAAPQKSTGEMKLFVHKEVGKISAAQELTDLPEATLAIGHSRWATHGAVTHANAHPHWDSAKRLALVHNGIFENYLELKAELEQQGVSFSTETDTEVAVQAIALRVQAGAELFVAVREVALRLTGRYAFVLFAIAEQRIIAVRNGAPLIVGIGQHETFIASDIMPFLEYTNDVKYLDDGEMVELTNDEARFFRLDSGAAIEKRLIAIEWKVEDAEKGDFEHFMLKEIFEQKETILRAIHQDPQEIEAFAQLIKAARGVFFLGCGTAGKVAHIGEYFFASIAKRHVNFAPASEFSLFHHFLLPETLLLAISQSGETADVIEALAVGKEAGSRLASLVNVQGSTIARMSDHSFLINAGPEKAVASTKAATSQISLLLLLAYATAGRIDAGQKLLLDTAAQINDLLNPRYLERVQGLAAKLKDAADIFIIGRGANYPLALEAAIKIQEVSYIHAEGFAGGELKHGPIALIQQDTPCIVLVGDDESKPEIISNAMELKARGGRIIGISPEREPVFDEWLRVPKSGIASPLVNLIPIQMLAYALAVAKGLDPDMPRNLAKSVTVK